MVGCGLHAVGACCGKFRSDVSRFLCCDGEVTLGCGLALLGACLGRLLLIEIGGIGRNLIIERLLQHVEVVLGVAFGLPQLVEFALCLVLHVLKDIDNASALGFVGGRSRGAHVQIRIVIVVLGLHEG